MTPDNMRSILFCEERTAALALFEAVVESPLFVSTMEKRKRQQIFAAMLTTAASRGYNDWLRVLLAYGADPNRKHEYETPLVTLAYQGDAETIDILLAHGAIIDRELLLIQRADDCNDGTVLALLERGADVNSFSTRYASPLHAATNCLGAVMELLAGEYFADVDACDSNGQTPLTTVMSGNSGHRNGVREKTKAARLLLDHSADVHVIDGQGCSVLHHALANWSIPPVRLFLELGASLIRL